MKLVLISYLIPFLLFTNTLHAQRFSLPNEEVIFSFETHNGKKITINKDKENRYIIYRFGTQSKIEFEFPDTTKSSWSKFTYSFYLRGGGKENEGMDLNYIYFSNDNYRYVIYDTYFAVSEEMKVGIKVTDLKTNKTTDIKGEPKSRKGTLINFRYNNLLEIGDEIFD